MKAACLFLHVRSTLSSCQLLLLKRPPVHLTVASKVSCSLTGCADGSREFRRKGQAAIFQDDRDERARASCRLRWWMCGSKSFSKYRRPEDSASVGASQPSTKSSSPQKELSICSRRWGWGTSQVSFNIIHASRLLLIWPSPRVRPGLWLFFASLWLILAPLTFSARSQLLSAETRAAGVPAWHNTSPHRGLSWVYIATDHVANAMHSHVHAPPPTRPPLSFTQSYSRHMRWQHAALVLWRLNVLDHTYYQVFYFWLCVLVLAARRNGLSRSAEVSLKALQWASLYKNNKNKQNIISLTEYANNPRFQKSLLVPTFRSRIERWCVEK